jgi:hypothetical protein
MRILVCGHSFVRRYREEYLLPQIPARHRCGVSTDFSDCFGLPGSYHPVFVSGRGGLMFNAEGVDFVTDTIEYLRPHILVLEVGTNDLVDGISPEFLCRMLTRVCDEILHTTSVCYIVLCQVVRRRRTRRCPPDEFERNRLRYNALIQRLARSNSRIYTYRHDRSILVSLHSSITHDNIHVTTGRGLTMYHFSIRRAITIALDRVF